MLKTGSDTLALGYDFCWKEKLKSGGQKAAHVGYVSLTYIV